jgi:YVTN family beta-propeller protein
VLGISILGPLEVLVDGNELQLRGAKPRALLVILILNRGKAVSADHLIDLLWGARPPATAAKALQVYISGLRKALGSKTVVTRAGGYLIAVGPEQVDVDRFEGLVDEGRGALENGEAERANEMLREALALWRGRPLADFAYEPFAQTEIARLEELRLTAIEDRVDAELALGRHAGVLGELTALAPQHPDRERLQRQLMLALYRSGRQADALAHYRRIRRRAAEELGLDPGPGLQQLERAILTQDPSLEAPSRPSAAQRFAARSRLSAAGVLIVAGGLLLLAAAIAAIVISSQSPEPLDVAPDSVAVIDAASGQLVGDVSVGARPTDISSDGTSVWVANTGDATVSRIDPKTRLVLSTTSTGSAIDGLGAGPAGVWVTDLGRAQAARLNPEFRGAVSARVRISNNAPFYGASGPVAVGRNAVWIGNSSAAVIRIDPSTGKREARVDVGNSPAAVAVGASAVWVADDEDNTVTKIDPRSANAVVETVQVGASPSAVAVGKGAVWVTSREDDDLTKIDPDTGSVEARIPVGHRPTGVAVGGGAVWVANSLSGTVSRIDPRSNRVVAEIEVGESPRSLVVSRGRVWVSVQGKPEIPPPETTGGDALRILLSSDPGGTDPAVSGVDFERTYETCALLLNYPDRQAPAGSEVTPELAAGPPRISDGGRTYSFEIRRGYRFSPPSNEPVTAAAFAHAIERVLAPQTRSYGATLLADIVGAEAYTSGKTEHLAGVKLVDGRLVIRLTAPAPDLVERLAAPWFCAVPPATPLTVSRTEIIPGAGPYYVASYDPDSSLVLRRNPNYPGDRPRRVPQIDYEIGIPATAAIARIEAGEADYYSPLFGNFGNEIPNRILRRLLVRYGPHSEAADSVHQQYFTLPALNIYYLMFNTSRPPFDDVNLRRAVNFALDRRALAREPYLGAAGRPTDQYIPPGVPGFRDVQIYPLGEPNLPRARELAGNGSWTAVLYTCNLPACSRFAQIVTENLSKIGITVETKQFPEAQLFTRITTPGEPYDLAQWPWIGDFPDPSNFINSHFDPNVSPLSTFHDPAFDRRMRRAAMLPPPQRYAAYARLDRELAARAAPAAAYATGITSHLFSSRIGCQIHQPIYGIDLGLLCIKD